MFAVTGPPVEVGVTMYVLSISSVSEVLMVLIATKTDHVVYYMLSYWKKIRTQHPEIWMCLCVCRSLEYLDCVHGLINLLSALNVAPGRNRVKWAASRRSSCLSSVKTGPETPMETKSRFKVTARRDPGLPPFASSVERASPTRPSSPDLHNALGMQISNRLCVSMMLHDSL